MARLEPGSQAVQECRRFAVMLRLLKLTTVHSGRRRFVNPACFFEDVLDRSGERLCAEPEFCEAVVEEIRSPGFLDRFCACSEIYGREQCPGGVHEFQTALRWLTEEHPQPAVRAAALEVAARAGAPAAADAEVWLLF